MGPFPMIKKSSKQSKTGQVRQNASCDTHLVISNLVSDTITYVNRETNTFTSVLASAHEPTKTVAPTSGKQNLKINSVDSFREKLFTRFLETASQLILSMRQSGSLSNYNSS